MPFADERLRRELGKARKLTGASGRRVLARRAWLVRALRWSGLEGAGRRNALALRLERHALPLAGLAPALDGLRVLHVSDPHFPERRDAALEDALVGLIGNTPHDLCVLTGDYRDQNEGPFDGALRAVERLREATGAPMLAVLGNHDPLAIVAPMRAMGIDVLLNEHVVAHVPSRGGAAFVIAGIDDPSYYRLHDLERALDGRAAELPVLLLAHSPEVADLAVLAGVQGCLSGHTHGGQIALPGGRPLIRHRGVPRDVLSGAWSRGAMTGYTSRGCGTWILDARFFCAPEVTLHSLVAVGRA